MECYITAEQFTAKDLAIAAIADKYGIKATCTYLNNSNTLQCVISEGPIDFIGNHVQMLEAQRDEWDAGNLADFIRQLRQERHIDVCTTLCREHFSGQAAECLEEIVAVMEDGCDDSNWSNYDNWFNDLFIGDWDKPYKLTV